MIKKSQVALEFIMTYGWAFFVILGIISTMMYFDVFNMDQFIHEKCEFSSGIYCIDGKIADDLLILILQNGMIIDIDDINLSVSECGDDLASGPTSLLSGEAGTYTLDCSINQKFLRGTIHLNYTNVDSGLVHRRIGKVIYRVR